LLKKKWSIGVFGAIFDGHKRLLLLNRSDGKGWNLPGGGLDVKKDNSLVLALLRELKEEIGFCNSACQLTPIGIYSSFKSRNVAVLYLVRLTDLPHIKLDDESEEYSFISREELGLAREILLVSQRMLHMCQDAFSRMVCEQ
jgi:8-oxo-dGTP diphosphatase